MTDNFELVWWLCGFKCLKTHKLMTLEMSFKSDWHCCFQRLNILDEILSDYPLKLAWYFVFIKLYWDVLVAFILERSQVIILHIIYHSRNLMLKYKNLFFLKVECRRKKTHVNPSLPPICIFFPSAPSEITSSKSLAYKCYSEARYRYCNFP